MNVTAKEFKNLSYCLERLTKSSLKNPGHKFFTVENSKHYSLVTISKFIGSLGQNIMRYSPFHSQTRITKCVLLFNSSLVSLISFQHDHYSNTFIWNVHNTLAMRTLLMYTSSDARIFITQRSSVVVRYSLTTTTTAFRSFLKLHKWIFSFH